MDVDIAFTLLHFNILLSLITSVEDNYNGKLFTMVFFTL